MMNLFPATHLESEINLNSMPQSESHAAEPVPAYQSGEKWSDEDRLKLRVLRSANENMPWDEFQEVRRHHLIMSLSSVNPL